MKRIAILASLCLTAGLLWIHTAEAGRGSDDQVTICHIPPGNPANRHTITVGAAAVNTHVRQHGDTIGPCESSADNCDDCQYRESDYAAGGCAQTCGHLMK